MPDPVDEQIRSLLARAVAEAPPAPQVSEVARQVDGQGQDRGSGPTRPGFPHAHPTGGRRPVLVAVAGVAAAALAVVGALAVGNGGRDVGTGSPGEVPVYDANPVRYVPTVVPDGSELATIDDTVAAVGDQRPAPRVLVFEGADGVRVRVVVEPFDTTTTTTPSIPPSSATTGTSPPPATSSTTETTSPPATSPSTTPPATAGSSSSGASGGPSTTIVAPGPAGPSDRPNRESAAVRGGVGAVEPHGDDATTIWFEDRGRTVAVDVFGLDYTGALRIVDGLVSQPDGGFTPAPGEQLTTMTDATAVPADRPIPATTTLAYQASDLTAGAASTLSVTTVELEPGRRDLLSATAGWFGALERWDDREVLVDDQQPATDDGINPVTASFVDAGGVLVRVAAGSLAELRTSVDGLQALDAGEWRAWSRDRSDGVAQLPVATSATLGEVTITEHRPADAEPGAGPGGFCLEADGGQVCRPSGPPGVAEDLTPAGGAGGTGHHVLVAGHWWYYGYTTDEATQVAVSPDRGGQPEMFRTITDGVAWFAVRLPDGAPAASISFSDAAGTTGEAMHARPAS